MTQTHRLVGTGLLVGLMVGWLIGMPQLPSLDAWQTAISEAQVGVSDEMLSKLFREGGLLAVLLVVFFFYRRDWTRINDAGLAQNQVLVSQNQVLVDLVRQVTRSESEMSAALRENTTVTHSFKNVIQTYFATETTPFGVVKRRRKEDSAERRDDPA